MVRTLDLNAALVAGYSLAPQAATACATDPLVVTHGSSLFGQLPRSSLGDKRYYEQPEGEGFLQDMIRDND